MKKQLCKLAIFALLLSTASCSDEQFAGDLTGGETTVTFNAQLPAGLQTRAAGDGQTATTLSYAVYEHGKTTPVITSEDEVKFVDRQASVSLRLAKGKTYDFLFWADAYEKGDTKNPYTVDFGTQTLTVNYKNALSNDESRDAFFGTEKVAVKGAVSQNITLKRPFAQLNIGTNDMEEARTAGINTGALQSSVTVSGIFKSMNLMTGIPDPSTSTEETFGFSPIPKEKFTVGDNKYDYLALNYLLVSGEKGLVNCKFSYTDGATTDTKTMTIDNVPVQRNYRTNIFGSLLTGSVDFDITIDPNFTTPDFNYQELLLAAKNGGKVVLTSDVTITESLVIAENVHTVVDLNGHNIINNTSVPDSPGSVLGNTTVFTIQNGATLDIRGEGKIQAVSTEPNQDGYRMAVYALGNSIVNIYGGDFYNYQDYNNGNAQLDLIYADQNAVINIYGGRFESACANSRGYWVLNLKGNSNAAINVYGGTFVNFDPSNSLTENPAKNFVVDGYSSVKISEEPKPYGTYQVVKGYAATDMTELAAAIEKLAVNGGELTIPATATIDISSLNSALVIEHPTTITIDGKLTSNKENVNLINRSELTLQGNGSVAMERRVVENHGTLTVNGGTYSTNVNTGGTVFWNNSEDAVMTLNDVTVNASHFAVAGMGEININGGTISSTSSNKYGAWAYCIRAQQGGKMTIKDATVKGVQGCIASIENSYITVENVNVEARNSEPSRQDAFYALYAASKGIIEVISGDFYSDRTPCCMASNDDIEFNPNGGFVLKGGRYSSKPVGPTGKEWAPEAGFKYSETGDTTYPYAIVAE